MVCSFACFDLHGLIFYARVNNLSVLSGWVYLNGSSNKQPVKISVCFNIYHPSRIGTISYPYVLYQFRCLALGHNTVTLTSVSPELANLQLSHCASHRHERLRQTLSIITLILLVSLLLINKKRLFTCFDSQKKRLI